MVIELREEMFNDTRFGAEVFYMHVRGVDTLMVLSYMHILKKSLFFRKITLIQITNIAIFIKFHLLFLR